MANLIITVISIALVAVAALMGAYYGGTAFMDGQVKAQANTIIEQAKQLETAWLAWTIDHGNDRRIASLSDFVPNYLTAVPVPPSTHATTYITGLWDGWSIADHDNDNSARYQFNPIDSAISNLLVTVIKDDKICNQIAKMAHGTNVVPLDPGHGGDPLAGGNDFNLLTTKFDCFRYMGDSPPANIVVYKVF